MRLRTYLLVLASVLALPAAGMTGEFGTPGIDVAAPSSPRAAAFSSRSSAIAPSFAEVPANAPAAAAPTVSWQLAHARPPGIEVFASADAAAPTLHVDAQTEVGTPRVLLVLRRADKWLEVLVPVRPNNAVGWVRADTVDLSETIDEIRVSLGERTLEWRHGTETPLTTSVTIGAASSPTPPGTYYVTDILPTSGEYGPWVLALNGHSDTYMQFNGEDARLALHGTDHPATIGQAASHGCVRLPNDLVDDLAQQLPIGTPVIIT